MVPPKSQVKDKVSSCKYQVHVKKNLRTGPCQGQVHAQVRLMPRLGSCQGKFMPRSGSCQVKALASVGFTQKSGQRQGKFMQISGTYQDNSKDS